MVEVLLLLMAYALMLDGLLKMMRSLRQLCARAFSAWQSLVAAVEALWGASDPRVESVGDFDFWP
jgi:hypothetical protein